MRILLGLTIAAAAVFSATPLVAQQPHTHGAAMEMPKEAVVVIQPFMDSKVGGSLTLTQETGGVHVKGKVTGLTPGKHGFHIHQFGDLRDPKGNSVGPHYNPTGAEHGGSHGDHRHVGDMGNIEAGADGVANVDVKAAGVELHFILGRSIVVHAKEDDLKTQPSGNSGDRIGIGVIGYAEQKPDAAGKK